MKRLLLLLGAIVLLGVFGAIVVLNPSPVEFHPTHLHSFHPMLGLLLILVFCAGALVTILAGSLRHLGRTLGGWRSRRDARVAAQAGEWHQAGEDLAWHGELDRSRALLQKAWKRHPGSTAAALALTSSYVDTGEYAAAQEVLEAAVARHAHDPDVRYALGEVLRRRGQTGDAIRMLETVRVQHPRAPRVLISLRELYRESGRWHEAAEIQSAYLQTLPGDAQAAERDRLVQLRYQAALALPAAEARAGALDAVVQSNRGFVPALVSLGDALVDEGRTEDARKVWEKAFKNQPRLIFIERLLAHDGGSRSPRAVALLAKYREQLDADSVHTLLARIALAAGDVDRAAAELQGVTAQDHPSVQRAWAEVFHHRGDTDKAWEALRRAADHAGNGTGDQRCLVCGRSRASWVGHCEGCDRWDTYRPATEATARSA